jgi:HlyD family secretion protein
MSAKIQPLQKPDTERSEAVLPLRVVDPGERAEKAKASNTSSRTRGLGWIIIPALMMALAAAGYWYGPVLLERVAPGLLPEAQQTTSNTAAPSVVPRIDEVIGLGKLMPEGDVIAIAAPFGSGDARIAELRVREGEVVERNSIIAVLDSEPALQAAIESARANLEVQRAILEQTKSGSSASRDEALASLESARSARDVAKLEFDRTATLLRRGIVSQSLYDQRRTTLDQAERTLQRAETTYSRFDETRSSGRQDIIVAERRVTASEAELRRVENDAEKAFIRAPVSGTILTVENQIGERPSSTGIATMANLERMTAEVEIYQTSIGLVAVGQKATLEADAFSEPLSGVVSRIGLEVRRQSVIDSSPAANTDARVVKVHVDLNGESTIRARPYTNMQITARIAVDQAQ